MSHIRDEIVEKDAAGKLAASRQKTKGDVKVPVRKPGTTFDYPTHVSIA
jgi:hypothetical protein